MKQTAIAVLLVTCVAIVAFWEIMSNRNRGLSATFELTANDLRDFVPRLEGWDVRSFPVETTALEPNIAALRLTAADGGSQSIVVRLVHGYNMRDCMRIKGYEVELVADSCLRPLDPATAGQARHLSHATSSSNLATRHSPLATSPSNLATRHSPLATSPSNLVTRHLPLATSSSLPSRLQVWRLASTTGDVSIWITTMLRTGDFAATDEDVRSMAFPRIGIPDDPNWIPRGVTLGSLRHPIRNLRMALRTKWNNSRCDLLTFLGLKRPAWASEELLTLVSMSGEARLQPESEGDVINRLAEAHTAILSELQRWRKEKLGE